MYSSLITERQRILEAASKCVSGKRVLDYGTPEESLQVISDLWSAYLGVEVSPVDASMMMALMKIARVRTGTATADSFVDIAGYAACGGELAAHLRSSNDEMQNEEFTYGEE